MMPIERAISHWAASPPAIRSGMTRGATGGRNDDTLARVESAPETELVKATKNEASMSRFSGVAVFWSSSWRDTIAPATANMLE
jgi:hypothetical protein